MKPVIALILAAALQCAIAQNWQDLSYSNIDIQSFNPDAFKPEPTPSTTPRTTSTTTVASTTTTKKSGGFFSGIKKIFGGGKKEEDVSTTTTVRPTSPTPKAAAPTTPRSVPVTTPKIAAPTPTPSTTQSRLGGAETPRSTIVGAPTPVPSTVAPGRPMIAAVGTSTTVKSVGGVSSTTSTPSTTRRTTTISTKDDDEWPALPLAGHDKNRGRPGGRTTTTRPSAVRPGGPGVTTKAPVVGSGPVSDAELATFSETAFNKDTNNVYRYITVNHQGRTQSSVSTDEAPGKLLTVDEQHAYRVPTIEKMRALYNNYELDTLVNEYVTPNEKKEENDFLDAVLATTVMRHAMHFLQQKGIADPDSAKHREFLKTIWFNTYSRGQGKIGSSGFEHVFLTELKNGTLVGLHNWVYFHDEEQQGRIDYKGYMKKLPLGNKGEIIKLRLCRVNVCKPTNSIFVGTSPELEMALYTVCFALRPDADCPLVYNGKTFTIKTHTWRYRGKNLIGSAFVEI